MSKLFSNFLKFKIVNLNKILKLLFLILLLLKVDIRKYIHTRLKTVILV